MQDLLQEAGQPAIPSQEPVHFVLVKGKLIVDHLIVGHSLNRVRSFTVQPSGSKDAVLSMMYEQVVYHVDQLEEEELDKRDIQLLSPSTSPGSTGRSSAEEAGGLRRLRRLARSGAMRHALQTRMHVPHTPPTALLCSAHQRGQRFHVMPAQRHQAQEQDQAGER